MTHPGEARLQQQLAQVSSLLRSGDTPAALAALQRLEQAYPQSVPVLRTHGIVLSRLGRDEEARARLEAVTRLDPASADAASDYASVLLNLGLQRDALKVLLEYLGAEGGESAADQNPTFLFNLARAYKWCGRAGDALPLLKRCLHLQPGHYGAWIIRGDVHKALGDPGAAADSFRRALGIQPADGTAWWSLANLKSGRFTDAELDQMKIFAGRAEAPLQKIFFEFALATACDQRNLLDQAFDHYSRGNQQKRQQTSWQRDAFSQWLKQIESAMDEVDIPARPAALERPRPVFIVSLPRSGSTLAEQVLAAHSQVTAAGELPWLPARIAAENSTRGCGLAQWAPRLARAEWGELGAGYLADCAAWHDGAAVFTDKLPGNIPFVGAMLAMLPDALVVHVRRDPMDVCWSCYRQLFIGGSDFVYDLEDLAAYWQDTEGHAAYWRRRAPDRFLTLDYEQLVRAPENGIRHLLEFLALPFEPECLEPQMAERAVNTASAVQVREAIHTRGLGHWTRYRHHLGPLAEALGVDLG